MQTPHIPSARRAYSSDVSIPADSYATCSSIGNRLMYRNWPARLVRTIRNVRAKSLSWQADDPFDEHPILFGPFSQVVAVLHIAHTERELHATGPARVAVVEIGERFEKIPFRRLALHRFAPESQRIDDQPEAALQLARGWRRPGSSNQRVGSSGGQPRECVSAIHIIPPPTRVSRSALSAPAAAELSLP